MRTFDIYKQGETLTFSERKSHPRDPHATLGMSLAPGALGPEPHIHLLQDEHFKITSGTLILRLKEKEIVLQEGDQAIVPKGSIHTFRNGSKDEPVTVEGGISPALQFEWMLVEMARSAIRNGGSWKDLPLLKAGYVLHELRDEYRMAAMPDWLHRPLFRLLHGIAKLTGAS